MSNSLQNTNNYNKNLKETSKSIFTTYVNIINNYIYLFFDNVKIQNKTYHLYIFKKGLECLSHIFNILLLYTNNIEITKIYCEKSYFYYVEFISQIENTNNNFLQLNSKDASLFIYKKTIFDINNDIRKQFSINNNNKIKIINCKTLTKIYNSLILIKFNSYSNNLKNITINLYKIVQSLINLYDNNEYQYYENIDTIFCFIDKFIINCKNTSINNININDTNDTNDTNNIKHTNDSNNIKHTNDTNNVDQIQNNQLLEIFISKLKKITKNKDYIKKNIMVEDNIDLSNICSPNKFINNLIKLN